ncbi:dienelactone hydrolase family protein [Paenibacillus silviterrae]|uniref:dienelactone hydrolase family protein n=1 Tax=Paenibacillus silviterrae TaxID=3242194 RepID=UPI0025428D37|nr:alpha/beta hydrolase family protein [Paenibacillus chinjuensis]
MRKPDAFLKQLFDELEKRREELNEPWGAKRNRVLSELQKSLGTFDLPHRGNEGLDPVLMERVELEEVVRERVEFSTLGGLRMPAYVVIPKAMKPGERRPGVLLWHGHGYGSRSLVGLDKDGNPGPETGKPSDNIALELARRGLVVLAPEIVGFGDRMLERDERQDPTLGNSCYNLSVSLMMSGKTTAGLRTAEALRAADYLSGRPEVSGDRLGTMGHSGGGIVASLSAALDPRIQASVVGIYPNTYRGSILAMRHCLCNYIPGILAHAEMPDVLALMAPRPLFVEAGIDDPIFPVETTKTAIEYLRVIYDELGEGARFRYDLFEGKHEVSGRLSFDWLAKTLQA